MNFLAAFSESLLSSRIKMMCIYSINVHFYMHLPFLSEALFCFSVANLERNAELGTIRRYINGVEKNDLEKYRGKLGNHYKR